MMPAAPLVGAVTTRPPAAFSSLTASAHRLTQSITLSGSASARSCRSRRTARTRRGAALDVQPAGQDQLQATDAAVDAGRHRGSNSGEAGADLGFAVRGQLVGAARAWRCQWPARASESSSPEENGYGRSSEPRRRRVAGDLLLVDHRAAADRIAHPRATISPAASKAVKRMPLEWKGKTLALVAAHVARFVESISCASPPAGSVPVDRIACDDLAGLLGAKVLRTLARAGRANRSVGRMALAGQRQRAEQLRLDPRHSGSRPFRRDRVTKSACRRHRPHCVRRRRPDADLE